MSTTKLQQQQILIIPNKAPSKTINQPSAVPSGKTISAPIKPSPIESTSERMMISNNQNYEIIGGNNDEKQQKSKNSETSGEYEKMLLEDQKSKKSGQYEKVLLVRNPSDKDSPSTSNKLSPETVSSSTSLRSTGTVRPTRSHRYDEPSSSGDRSWDAEMLENEVKELKKIDENKKTMAGFFRSIMTINKKKSKLPMVITGIGDAEEEEENKIYQNRHYHKEEEGGEMKNTIIRRRIVESAVERQRKLQMCKRRKIIISVVVLVAMFIVGVFIGIGISAMFFLPDENARKTQTIIPTVPTTITTTNSTY